MKKKTKPTAPQPEPFPRVYEMVGLPFFDSAQFGLELEGHDFGKERKR